MKLHSFILAALTASTLPAQCLFTTVTTQSIGPSCNAPSTGFCAIAAIPASLSTLLDTANCSLEVAVNAFSGCGATVPLRFLVLGTQPAAVPLPEFGLGCMMHVAPAILLATTTSSFPLNLPPNVASLNFLAQGAALSTFAFPGSSWNVLAFTAGLAISLQ